MFGFWLMFVFEDNSNVLNKHSDIAGSLLLRIREGEASAFEQLYMELYPAVFLLSTQLTGSEELAKDIVSETFLHLWESRAELTEVRDLKAYLYVSARNRALNYLRSRERSRQRDAKALHEPWLVGTPEDELQAFFDTEMIHGLYRAMQTLPPECRRVAELGMEGFSTTEIAERLLVTPSAVSQQKARAIRLLRGQLVSELVIACIWHSV